MIDLKTSSDYRKNPQKFARIYLAQSLKKAILIYYEYQSII